MANKQKQMLAVWGSPGAGKTVTAVMMNEVIYEGTELLARAFCHEIDHLDGKMYTDLVEGELHRTSYEED